MKKIFKVIFLMTFTILTLTAQEEKLIVEGAIQIGNTDNPAPVPGTIRWNGLDFEGWNGAFWVSLSKVQIASIIYDIDGHEYRTVKIGTQIWMAENLRTTRYVNGDEIPQVENDGAWAGLTTGGFCWYNHDSMTYERPYGKLYNWYTAVDTRNLCPAGWHTPSHGEWTQLADYLGGHLTAGGKMKEAGNAHWSSPNTEATNNSGFTGLPGGLRYSFGTFDGSLQVGNWWSSTVFDAFNARCRNLAYDDGALSSDSGGFRNGFSVRCVKN